MVENNWRNLRRSMQLEEDIVPPRRATCRMRTPLD